MQKRLTHRLCIPGYARIIRGLIDCPATNDEISLRHDVTQSVVRGITRRLKALRVIHIDSWRPAKQGPAMRVYGFGDAPDAPQPLTKTGKQSCHVGASGRPPPKPTSEIVAFASLLKALKEPQCIQDLVDLTGIGRVTLYRNIKIMRDLKLVHVSGWYPSSRAVGPPTPMYQFGVDKRGAARPKPLEKRETSKRHNTMLRARREQLQFMHLQVTNDSKFTQQA